MPCQKKNSLYVWCVHCIAFIICKEKNVCVVEYNIADDECDLKCKHTFKFANDVDVKYDIHCGVCVLNNDAIMENEFKHMSNDENSNQLNQSEHEKYSILLFGSGYHDSHINFLSSLQWLSLHIMNDNNNSCIVCIDEEQTKQFQNIFIDKNIFAHTEYRSFGYTKWKHYLLFFGGEIRSERIHKSIDSIFYFDFLQMKWHKSLKVKPFHTNTNTCLL